MSRPRREQHKQVLSALTLVLASVLLLGVAGRMAQHHLPNQLIFVTVATSLLLAYGARVAYLTAQRYRVGADSEEEVKDQLAVLSEFGWQVRHGMPWPGGGDIDHVALAPTGRGFVIETKTRRFTREHLERSLRTAEWAARQARRCPLGVMPVLCVVRERELELVSDHVLVVSLDRLLDALSRYATPVALD